MKKENKRREDEEEKLAEDGINQSLKICRKIISFTSTELVHLKRKRKTHSNFMHKLFNNQTQTWNLLS